MFLLVVFCSRAVYYYRQLIGSS